MDLGTVDIADSLSLNVAASAFGDYIGSDKLSFGCESFVTNTQAGGGGNIVVTQNTQAGCGAKVTYTYTPPRCRWASGRFVEWYRGYYGK